jgi:dTDP-4-dehydrorhamnose reductase
VKVLITGASGQVGRALQSLKPANIELLALKRAELDISDETAVRRALSEFTPAVLINAAAYTAVDRAESEAQVAMAVNSLGPRYLATAVADIAGARMVHISTDYVFDGRGSKPHRPNDPTNPLSVYGHTKLAGEQAVLGVLGDRAVVLRTAWIYAPEGKNFPLTMVRLMKERGAVYVVSDQRGAPTAADSVARALWRIVERADVNGILHWTDQGSASWYEFACAIAEDAVSAGLLGHRASVSPIKTVDYPTPAMRPHNSVLDLSDTMKRLDLDPTPWRENLRATLRVLARH